MPLREAVLRELVDAMPHIVWTQDAAGVASYFNRAWIDYTGQDLAATLAEGPSTFVHPDDRDAVRAAFAAGREEGGPFEATYRLRRQDGEYLWHSARVVPLGHAEGRVTGWVGTAVEIDLQRRADLENRFLVEATKVLGTSLDVTKTLDDVARLVVPHLADWCAIDLVDEQGVLSRATVAHVDPAKVALARELWKRAPPRPEEPTGPYAAMRTREAQHIEEISDTLLVELVTDQELLAILRSLGLRSSMCIPLVARDRALGALTLVAEVSGRRYVARDVAFAQELARRIALAVDNARLYEEATRARAAAEAVASDIIEQSKAVEAALLAMRAERDAAVARARALEGSGTAGDAR